MGHVVRCLALADELREKHGCTVSFAMRTSELGISRVREQYPVLTSSESNFNYFDWLSECLQKTDAQVLVLDVRDGLQPKEVLQLKTQTGIKVVTIDDPEDKRLAADLAFYPPVPQVTRWDWSGMTGKLHHGWEFAILNSAYRQPSAGPDPNGPVLISMGGSDPGNLTASVLYTLMELKKPVELAVILGRGYCHGTSLEDLIDRSHHPIVLHRAPQGLVSLLGQSRAAILSFGVTAYEAASMRIPAYHVCLTDDHYASAGVFSDDRATGRALVSGGRLLPETKESIRRFVLKQYRKSIVRKNYPGLGRGTALVCRMIIDNLKESGD